MFSAEFDGERALADLNLTRDELELARRRGLSRSLRLLRTVARRQLRDRTGLRPGSISRRVRIYPLRGKLWIGAGAAPLITSYADVKTVPIRRRRRGEQGDIPRAVIDRGVLLKGVFVRQTGEHKGIPFRVVPSYRRSLESVRRPYGPEAEQAWEKAIDLAPPIIDRAFREEAERVIRARS